MRALVVLVIVSVAAAILSTCNAEHCSKTHPLRPQTVIRDVRHTGVNCLSWHLAVETNNVRNWKHVPVSCEGYVGNYLLGKQYRQDCETVANAAISYAKTVKLGGDGKDVWVFDIDETTLSNIPYYARSDVLFGTIPHNNTKFNSWVGEGKAPAIPSMLKLYKTVQSLGFKTIFITGTGEDFKRIRIANLKNAGYTNWEKLILKGAGDGHNYKPIKRTALVKQGYRIAGNVGDQWSDLLGDNPGNRTFKVPDPIYYIA